MEIKALMNYHSSTTNNFPLLECEFNKNKVMRLEEAYFPI